MIIRHCAAQSETTAHGFSKWVLLPGGVLPSVTQLAVAELPPGAVVEMHSHPTMYEVFYPLDGEADYILREMTHSVGPGDLVVVEPGVRHSLRAGRDGHRVLYFGISTASNPV